MNLSENQQSPAQAALYGMKHGPNTANMNCLLKIIHYSPDPGLPWNKTAGVFRVETNDHQ